MPLLISLIFCGVLVAAFLLLRRFQRGAYVIGGVLDAPSDVRAAAKRAGFQAHPNMDTIASIHTPELCVAGMAAAFAQMDDVLPPGHEVLRQSVSKHLKLAPEQIEDYCILAPWFVEQGGGPTPAFEQMTKRLKQLDHGPFFGKMMSVLGDITAAGTKGMPSARQADAMGALARIFRTA